MFPSSPLTPPEHFDRKNSYETPFPWEVNVPSTSREVEWPRSAVPPDTPPSSTRPPESPTRLPRGGRTKILPSRMADYSKKYREMKKRQTADLAEGVERLTAEHAEMSRKNSLLTRRLQSLEEENRRLKEKRKDTHAFTEMLAVMRKSPGAVRLAIGQDGVPFLEVV